MRALLHHALFYTLIQNNNYQLKKVAMKNLYAPWRDKYTTSTVRSKKTEAKKKDCIFCSQFEEHDDEKYFIFRRFFYHAIMFNRYPYNAGHLLIIPFKHTGNLDDYCPEARFELIELVHQSTAILQKELGAEGVNTGLNIGKAAGAGIPSHLHMHVLPRWHGDTNYMPTLAQVKPISFDLHTMYQKLKPAFDAIDHSSLNR